MGWFVAQAFVLLAVSFGLGLAVGYLWWVSRLRRSRSIAAPGAQCERHELLTATLRSHHDLDLRVIAQLTQERDTARARLASILELPVSEVA